MNALFALGLAFAAGATFGWATALWFRIHAEEKRPRQGTPAARFNLIMRELERRFPHPQPYRSDVGPELFYLMAIDAARGDTAGVDVGVNALGWARISSPRMEGARRRRFGSGCVPFKAGE